MGSFLILNLACVRDREWGVFGRALYTYSADFPGRGRYFFVDKLLVEKRVDHEVTRAIIRIFMGAYRVPEAPYILANIRANYKCCTLC